MGDNPINVEKLKSNFGTIDKPKVADDFVKNHVKEAKVDGSIFDFEGLEGLKRTKTIGKTQIDMSEFESIKPKAGFFTGLKEKAANAWSGIKSKFSNLTSKFKTSSANSAGAGSKLAGAKNWIKGMGGKIKNGLKAAPSKVGRFFKGKGGKWALVGLAAAAVTAAGVGIYKAVKGNSDNKAQETEGADKANKPAQPENLKQNRQKNHRKKTLQKTKIRLKLTTNRQTSLLQAKRQVAQQVQQLQQQQAQHKILTKQIKLTRRIKLKPKQTTKRLTCLRYTQS